MTYYCDSSSCDGTERVQRLWELIVPNPLSRQASQENIQRFFMLTLQVLDT